MDKIIIRNGRKIYTSDYSNKTNRRIRYALKKELQHTIHTEIESSPEYIERRKSDEMEERGIAIMKRIGV